MKAANMGILLLAGSVMATAQQPERRPGRVSIQATIEDTYSRKLIDGNVVTNTITGRYFRDDAGRTRSERGDVVTIEDPSAGTLTVLDLKRKIARKHTSAQRTQARLLPTMGEITGHTRGTDLGTRTIEGLKQKAANILL